MGSIVLNQSCSCSGIRIYLALRKRVCDKCVQYTAAKRCHTGLHKHTSEGSAVASNVPSDISEQTTEGSEDNPVSQRSQGSYDDHEGGLLIVRNLFDGCCLHSWSPLVTLINQSIIIIFVHLVHVTCKHNMIVSDVGEAVFTRPRPRQH